MQLIKKEDIKIIFALSIFGLILLGLGVLVDSALLKIIGTLLSAALIYVSYSLFILLLLSMLATGIISVIMVLATDFSFEVCFTISSVICLFIVINKAADILKNKT